MNDMEQDHTLSFTSNLDMLILKNITMLAIDIYHVIWTRSKARIKNLR